MAEEIIDRKLDALVQDAFKALGKDYESDEITRDEARMIFKSRIDEEDWDEHEFKNIFDLF